MKNLSLVLLSLFILISSCKEDTGLTPTVDTSTGLTGGIITNFELQLNPTNIAPLTALLKFTTNQEVSIQLKITGLNGAESDVIRDFSNLNTNFELPVIGLYAAHNNQVELTFFDANSSKLGEEIIEIQTTDLIPELPQITIDKLATSDVTPGWNLVNYFGHTGAIFPQRPFMYDEFGDIRWYLDFSNQPTFSNLFFDNGLNRLKNGNFIFGNANNGFLYEVSLLGQIINSWNLNGLQFHHTVIEKKDGNLLATVSNPSIATVEDLVIEINRNTKSVVRRWDLNQSLNNKRTIWDSDITDIEKDWFHANSLYHTPNDNTIIVSGRTQGVVKLTESNEVVWILAPHKDWGTSGNGKELTQFLLQPLDANGIPIEDIQVLNGDNNHTDFEWPWYQHSAITLPNGNLLLFDNGENRNYSSTEKYSRAVEYKIDELNKTIQQVWDYGKERGASTYSRIVSKVGYHETTDNILFTPGAILFEGKNYGKTIEVDRQSNQVVFEATLTPPMANFNITFHNTQRVLLFDD